ncbi:MAG TPA: heme-dependent oxidative N-demethylase subunit alpha family protein [Burkholderiaceae bacterium]
MSFDFDSAVSTPFRMQPGLRRMADAATHLMPMAAGSRHQREKLAILSAQPEQALQVVAGFDASPAFHALAAHAAREHPQAFTWDGERACAPVLGVAVHGDHRVEEHASGSFGLGDEIGRCLRGLSPKWRLAGLLSLAFVEDFALVDGATGTLPWLAVALPSHWAPEDKVGRHFREVHAPVADNELLLRAGDHLMRMVCGPERWERFVWNVTRHPRLNAHPASVDHAPWPADAFADARAPSAWWRTERQTFIALPGRTQAVFTIQVQIEALGSAIDSAERAARLHDAVATMSDAVLAYRSLSTVRDPLLRWLATKAA